MSVLSRFRAQAHLAAQEASREGLRRAVKRWVSLVAADHSGPHRWRVLATNRRGTAVVVHYTVEVLPASAMDVVELQGPIDA